MGFRFFRCAVLAVVAAWGILPVAGADENCAACNEARFPEAASFLAEQGFPESDYKLLLAWTEGAAQAPQGVLAGFRLKPVAGGEAFDLYASLDGKVLLPGEAASLGVRPKNWDIKPMMAPTELHGPQARSAPPVAVPVPVAAPSASVALPQPDMAKVLAEDAAGLDGVPKGVSRIGVFVEPAAPLEVSGQSASAGVWQTLPDGRRVWSVVLEAPGARGQRVHFAAMDLPEGAGVLVYNADDPKEAYGPFTGPQPGDTDFFSPTCFGERVSVELTVPTGADASNLRLVIDKSVYIYVGFGDLAWAKIAGSCNLDVTCYPEWAVTAAGVGGIGTIGQSGFLFCTGTLIADGIPGDPIPYFLTANHCVGSAAEASTVEVYWMYQSSQCNGPPPHPVNVPRTTGGADYLAGSNEATGSDFALLRLRQEPPSNIPHVGWTTEAVPNGESVTCIHHPSGDYKRISFATTNTVAAQEAGQSPTRYIGVYWTDGVTEPGSSGSPLFLTESQLIVGQLWGGASSCQFPFLSDAYGRFDRSYPLMQQFLEPHFALLRPNGGEVWTLGSTEAITWESAEELDGPVTIELLRQGLAVLEISAGTENDGLFEWTIPMDLPPSPAYRVRVSVQGTNSTVQDESDASFTLVRPTGLVSVTPDRGPAAGGTAVTVTGSEFPTAGAFELRFGGVLATNLVVVDSTTITAVTPAHAPGLVDVALKLPSGETLTLANAFTYLAPDTDGDGIPDEVEGTEDPDEDGLPNFNDLDSDGDGIPDADETAEDADGDTIPNFLDLDSDDDGMSDEWENDHQLNPYADDANEDPDGDGVVNIIEYQFDTDPQDPQSFPRDADLSVSSRLIVITAARPEGVFSIINRGELPLSWTVASSSPNVIASPDSGSGETVITVGAADYDLLGMATLTVANAADPGDVETVEVWVADTGYGDLNGDATVNAIDLQMLVNQILGVSPEPNPDADLSFDARVDAVDVQLMVNIILGLR